MSTKEYVISHPSQLNSLSVMPLAKISGIGAIRLTGTFEKHPQRAEFERKLNGLYRACGCDMSAKVFLGGVILSGALAVFKNLSGDWSLGMAAAVVLGVGAAGLMFGKLAGLAQANGRLRATVREIQQIWIPEKGHREEKGSCG